MAQKSRVSFYTKEKYYAANFRKILIYKTNDGECIIHKMLLEN